jgi:hypothetical protein
MPTHCIVPARRLMTKVYYEWDTRDSRLSDTVIISLWRHQKLALQHILALTDSAPINQLINQWSLAMSIFVPVLSLKILFTNQFLSPFIDCCYYFTVTSYLPVTVAARSNCKAWTVIAHSNTGIVGSNPTYGIDVCLRLFGVCVFLCR